MSEQDLLNVTIGDEETTARPVEFDEAGLAIKFHTTCPKCSQLIEIPRAHKFSCQSCGVIGSTPFVPTTASIPARLVTEVPPAPAGVVIQEPKKVVEQVVQQGPIIDPIVAGTFPKELIDESAQIILIKQHMKQPQYE